MTKPVKMAVVLRVTLVCFFFLLSLKVMEEKQGNYCFLFGGEWICLLEQKLKAVLFKKASVYNLALERKALAKFPHQASLAIANKKPESAKCP